MTISVRAASVADIDDIVRLNRGVQPLHAEPEPSFFKAELYAIQSFARQASDVSRAAVESSGRALATRSDNARNEPVPHAATIIAEGRDGSRQTFLAQDAVEFPAEDEAQQA